MIRKFRKYVLMKAIYYFCDNTPTWAIRQLLPEVDHIKLRNTLPAIARIYL